MGPSALGGRFTTIEGLITAMKEQLADPKQSCIFGDSSVPDTKIRFQSFLKKIEEIIENKREATVILDDPAGNSYVQSMRDDDLPDDGLRITRYERSYDQNEELGLNDMKTENYEAS